ncbi:MAG: DUF1572 family protein [Flavobacteriales bacterium]|nr:DUF1572 family protein [Flavobacteriales bacterium]
MPMDFLLSARTEFAYYRQLGEKTSSRRCRMLTSSASPHQGNNSIAVIVKHLHGNMRSRWTDFLTSDGEKPWRQRDAEFENDLHDREELMARWSEGWSCLFNAIDPLTPEDLQRIALIRTEPHTVAQAITRQLAHVPYHVGQIVLLGKLFLGENFRSLSIPRGGSRSFNVDKGM